MSYSPNCLKRVDYYVPKGHHYKKLDYPCGATGIDGNPVLCEPCAKATAGRNWRQEAEAMGERWDEED
jgi:hypothetical protein